MNLKSVTNEFDNDLKFSDLMPKVKLAKATNPMIAESSKIRKVIISLSELYIVYSISPIEGNTFDN